MEKQKRNRVRANGDGCIINLGGKRKNPWTARVTVGYDKNGKQKFKYIGYYKNKTAAKAALANYLINPYNLDKLTTEVIFEKWVETAKFTETVLKNYKRVIDNSGLAKKVFKDIKLMQLEDAARELTPAMQKRYKAAWKNLYLYAMKHDIVDKNLADLMELDKYRAKERDAISAEDIKKILAMENVIPKLLLFTGTRINELLSIKSKNVDIKNRIMVLGSKTAAGRNRRVPISKEIMPIIESLLSKGTDYLITDDKGRKVNYNSFLTNFWNKNDVLKKYVIHQTRHSFVSRCIKLKLDRGTLQKIIGHVNKDTTDIYTHILDEDLVNWIDNFNY